MAISRKRGGNRSWRSEDFTTTTWRTSGRKLLLLWYLWSRAWFTYHSRQAPCICHLLAILNLSHLLDALGDRSCVLNQLLHFLPWIWLLLLNPLFYKKVFLMLSFALEKQNVLFWQKMMLQSEWDVFKNKTWWWIHHGHDGFNIGKDVPLPGTKLSVWNDKAETGRVTCTRRESRCSVSVRVD